MLISKTVAALIVCAGAIAIPLLGDNPPPVEVIIIGVPSTGVSQYKDSPLGAEITKVCAALYTFFTAKPVQIIERCTDAETTFDKVDDLLKTYFQGDQRGRVTLLFVMTHGEPTTNGDVRLLMHDTTDSTRGAKSLLLTDLAQDLSKSDTLAIAFIDACYSGAVSGRLASALRQGAQIIDVGAQVGVLTATQADQQSLNLSFTKALIDTWKSECPQNEDDFISAVTSRMPDGTSSPTWLVPYHGSACFGDLIAPDKRIMTLWRDPTLPSAQRVKIQVFDDRDHSMPAKSLWTIPSDPTYIVPYVMPLAPGVYRVEARLDSNPDVVVDKRYCDFSSEPYCEYTWPAVVNSLTSLDLETATYGGAAAVGYPSSTLETISSRAALFYGDAVGSGGAGLKAPASAPGLMSALRFVRRSPALLKDIQEYRQGTKTPFPTLVGRLPNAEERAILAGALSSIAKGDTKGGADKLQKAGEELASPDLNNAAEVIKTQGMSNSTMQKVQAGMKKAARQ